MAITKIDKRQWQKVINALRLTYDQLNAEGMTIWNIQFEDVIYQCQCSLEIEGLEEIRPIMRATLGYDPLAPDTRPKGEKQKRHTKSEAEGTISLQDLRRKIYTKAKAEEAWRFWGLYVHITKMETLHEAYRLAKANNGAPGIDGVTFKAIEESGVEDFLKGIRDDLESRTYLPMRNRKKEIPKSGGKKTRMLSIPAIRDRGVQGAVKLILEPIFEADFQPGSFGYRPNRSAQEAVNRVSQAVVNRLTRVIDVDLRAYFDNVRHHIMLEKVAKRVKDNEVMRLLRLILKASGKKGIPQGGLCKALHNPPYAKKVIMQSKPLKSPDFQHIH